MDEKAARKATRSTETKPKAKPKGEEWVPVALKPEPLELVDLKLPDDTTCIGAWTGRIWWTRERTVQPVAWRKRPHAAFASLILK